MASFIVRTWRAAGYELPVAADEPFTDVAPDNAHYENIRILLESGVTRGTTATTYSPADPVTRVQMASFVTRAASFGFSPPGTEASTTDFDPSGTEPADKFVDLPEFTDLQGTTGEQARDVQAAGELLGLTAGTTPTTFSPRQPVTRAQMATFVVRLLDTTLTPDQALEYAAVKGRPLLLRATPTRSGSRRARRPRGQPNSCSSTAASPSSAFEGATSSAAASTCGCALPIA